MGDSQLEPSSIVVDAIRKILSFFDRAAFWLLGLVYELFFNVASADLFANSSLMKFYGRMQLILGVFMMFQLALTILKGIVNPDTITDSKSGGAMQFVYRIAVSLVLLTLLVPFETGRSNEFEKQISNNGLLFGTLYSLQNRILANNTIGRLVLGTNETNYFSTDLSAGRETLRTSARVFTSTILKGFYRINLLPESSRPKHEDGKDDAIFNDNRVCQDFDDAMLNAYTRVDADPGEIISMVNETCSNSSIQGKKSLLSIFRGNKYYRFAYNGFISMIVGFVFVVIMFSFTIEVAVRSVKLAVLRIIAPVPIISYMDPKGSKDNAFNTWVKTLSSTYLDLFIRLATIYFVLFIIQSMITNGVVINYGTGVIGVISVIIIWIGLFAFAKQAPKFIRAIFGLKDEGPGLLSGFKALGEGLGLAAVPLGAIGSARANWRAASEENKELGRGRVASTFLNAGSALAGAIAGGYVGGKAAFGKDGSLNAVLDAQSKRNARRAGHYTLPGQIVSDAYGLFNGRSIAARDQMRLDASKNAFDLLKKLKSTAEEEALKQQNYLGEISGVGEFNYGALEAALERARGKGDLTFDYSYNGVTHTGLTTDFFTKQVMEKLKESQTGRYLEDQVAGVSRYGAYDNNGTLMNAVAKAQKAVNDANYNVAGNGYPAFNSGDLTVVKKTIGRAAAENTEAETNMTHIMNRAVSRDGGGSGSSKKK